MPVPKALMSLALPTILSQIIAMLYNIADMFFVGIANDPNKTAAVSFAYTLSWLSMGIANLFGIGGGSLVSRLLGVKNDAEAKNVSSFSFYGCIITTVLYIGVIALFEEKILYLIGASEETLDFARQYVFWVVIVGSIPAVVNATLANLLRSEGFAQQSSFGLGFGAVLNIILDPVCMFLVFPKGQEVTGAAIATMSSNMIATVYFIVVILRLKDRTVLSLSPKHIRLRRDYVGQIFAIGLPSAMGCILACASNIVLNKLMSYYGTTQQAAIGIVKKVDMLPMNVGMGLCQGMMPLVAYNYSAKNYKRMRAVANFARLCGIVFAAACIVLFESLARPIVNIFINDTATLDYGADFLRIACIAVPLMITNFQMNFMFQAMGKGLQSLILNSCRQGLFNIPCLFLLNYLFGEYGLVWAQLMADMLTLIISFALYRSVQRQLDAEEREMEAIEA